MADAQMEVSMMDLLISTLRVVLAKVGLALSLVLLATFFLLAGSPSPAEAGTFSPHTGSTCAQTAPFPYPSAVVGIAATPDDGGYWIVTSG